MNELSKIDYINPGLTRRDDMTRFQDQLIDARELVDTNHGEQLVSYYNSQDDVAIQALNNDQLMADEISQFNQMDAKDRIGSSQSKKIARYICGYIRQLIGNNQCDFDLMNSFHELVNACSYRALIANQGYMVCNYANVKNCCHYLIISCGGHSNLCDIATTCGEVLSYNPTSLVRAVQVDLTDVIEDATNNIDNNVDKAKAEIVKSRSWIGDGSLLGASISFFWGGFKMLKYIVSKEALYKLGRISLSLVTAYGLRQIANNSQAITSRTNDTVVTPVVETAVRDVFSNTLTNVFSNTVADAFSPENIQVMNEFLEMCCNVLM